nr:uncharacterized protein LOC102461641 isoform X2 [Pelodiscus sinensis]|eukprot:XP_006122411.1 uncharacterized protein LOC102461641 isoform X2 [Pelodiscus sinensis]
MDGTQGPQQSGKQSEGGHQQLGILPTPTPQRRALYTPRETPDLSSFLHTICWEPPCSNDTAVMRCFKCNEPGHVKADCPQSTNRLQLMTPGLPQGASGPDASLIPPAWRETVRVGGREVVAWRDTRAQVSVIHHSLVDPKAIDPETLVTIQPFKVDPFDLPTAKLPVQYKGWSGTWTFAVYDDYAIPMLVGKDLANHVKQAKRVGVIMRSKATQAVHPDTPNPAQHRTKLAAIEAKAMKMDCLPVTSSSWKKQETSKGPLSLTLKTIKLEVVLPLLTTCIKHWVIDV